MRLRFSDIGHWIGWCPKKRRSQIVPDQDFVGITTTEEFTMDAKKDEIGVFIPISFTKRMLLYVVVDLLLINLIVFYWHEKLSLSIVLMVSLIEMIALAAAFAFWIPRYQRAGAQVKW